MKENKIKKFVLVFIAILLAFGLGVGLVLGFGQLFLILRSVFLMPVVELNVICLFLLILAAIVASKIF